MFFINEKNKKVIDKLKETANKNRNTNEFLGKMVTTWKRHKSNHLGRNTLGNSADTYKIELVKQIARENEAQRRSLAESLVLNPVSFSKMLLKDNALPIDVCKVMIKASEIEKEKPEMVELADYAILGLGVLAAVPTMGASLAMSSTVLAIKLGSDYTKLVEAEEKRNIANVVNAGQEKQTAYYSEQVKDAQTKVLSAQSAMIKKLVDAYLIPKVPFLSKLNVESYVKNGLKGVLGKSFAHLEAKNKLSLISNKTNFNELPALKRAMDYATHVAAKPPRIRMKLQGKVNELFELATKAPKVVDKAYSEAFNAIKRLEKQEADVWKYVANPTSDATKAIIEAGINPDMNKVGSDIVTRYHESDQGKRTVKFAKTKCNFE